MDFASDPDTERLRRRWLDFMDEHAYPGGAVFD